MKKTVIIIQARIGSKRLPCKMMLSLHGHPIIEWVVKRVQKARLHDGVIVAIPDTEKDDLLAFFLDSIKANVYRGKEEDVLNRFYEAAKSQGASHIVRVCADNPLISGKEIDNLIDFYGRTPCDYAYNHIPVGNNYPDGLGAEMVAFSLLEKLEYTVTEQRHREHCFSYIWDNPNQFVIKTFNPPNLRIHRPNLKLDIDTFEDYRKLALKNFSMDIADEELVELFRE
ncbi:MAG: NTP transferase domain-containing protein [Thermodesulfobacteriota bacterium]